MIVQEFKIVYIDNWQDGPISGHAWADMKYYVYFQYANMDPESGAVEVYRPSDDEMVKLLAGRKLFEDLMGYHFSYPCLGNQAALIDNFKDVSMDKERWNKNKDFIPNYEPNLLDYWGVFPAEQFCY